MANLSNTDKSNLGTGRSSIYATTKEACVEWLLGLGLIGGLAIHNPYTTRAESDMLDYHRTLHWDNTIHFCHSQLLWTVSAGFVSLHQRCHPTETSCNAQIALSGYGLSMVIPPFPRTFSWFSTYHGFGRLILNRPLVRSMLPLRTHSSL